MHRLYLLVALVATCAAQNPPEAPYRIGGGVTAPIPIAKPEPRYSEEARKAKLQGTVVLMIVVDADGKPRDIKVIRPLGLGLDQEAIEAVEKWRFKPGMKEGQPVAVQAAVEVNFRLLKELRWRLTDISYHPLEGASTPTVIHDKYPPPVNTGSDSSITLSFSVDQRGVPTNVRIEKSSYGTKDDEILEAVREWRFTPGMKDRKAVEVPCAASFVLSEKPPKAPQNAVAPSSAVEAPAKTIDPAKLAAIEELFSLMKMDRMMQTMKSQVEAMMSQTIQKSVGDMDSLNPEQRAIFAKEMPEFMKRLMGAMWERVSLEKLKPEFVKIYDETFTAEEINGAIAFYKTPAGSAMIEKLPVVTGKVMGMTQHLIREAMPEVMKMTAQWAEDMKKKYGESLNEK